MVRPNREVTIIPGTGNFVRARNPYRQLRVASYSRVSTDMEEQLTSFHTQTEYYTDMILKNPDWTLAGTYSDEGISGASAKKRPGFMRMMKHCKKGKIDIIITKSISRFARNTIDSITYVRMLKSMDIGIIFEKEGLNTMEQGNEFVLTLLSGMAQEELISTSKNISMGKRMAMQKGKVDYHYDHFYGYRKGEDGAPEIIPEQAAIITRIYHQYLAGQTPRKIAQGLTEEGIIYHRKKARWSDQNIRSILTNEKYSGDAILQKTYVVDPISKEVRVNNGELPKILIKYNHDGIVSREIFHQVQEERAKRNSRSAKVKESKTGRSKYSSLYALGDILVCGHCNTPYRRVTWSNRKKGYRPVWRCISRLKYNKTYCTDSVTIDEAILHRTIMEAILTSYRSDNVIPMALTDALRTAMRNQPAEEMDIHKIERKITQLIDETMEILERTTDDDNGLSAEESNRQMQVLSDEAKRLQAIVDDYKRVHQDVEQIENRVDEIKNYLESQPPELMTYNDALVRQIIHTIQVIGQDKIIIHFKNGTILHKAMEVYTPN